MRELSPTIYPASTSFRPNNMFRPLPGKSGLNKGSGSAFTAASRVPENSEEEIASLPSTPPSDFRPYSPSSVKINYGEKKKVYFSKE